MSNSHQTKLFRGIYEFEDPSGTLLAAKIPVNGTADLFDGTVIVVKPNQAALLIYKGKMADLLPSGSHMVSTENIPVITSLANWRYGFRSPLRCEIWFFSGSLFQSRRWGTSHPVMHDFEDIGSVGLRAYGMYNIGIRHPQKLFNTLIGSQIVYDVTALDDFIQGLIIELLPQAIMGIKKLSLMSQELAKISARLQKMIIEELTNYGIFIDKLQVLSIVPPKEVLQAMDAKSAIKVIGDQQSYLLYKAANSLDALGKGPQTSGAESMQMMMGLMLGKGLVGMDYKEKERLAIQPKKSKTENSVNMSFCHNCGQSVGAKHHFCSNCGAAL